MEFSFDTPRPSAKDSAIGSDRLRKAIERNRAKQAKRSDQASRAGFSAAGAPPSEATVTRRSVASPAQDVEFTTALRKGNPKPPAPVSYRSSTPTKKTVRTTSVTRAKRSPKAKKILKNTNELILKGIWVFCGILLLRLVFSDGGVRDYYDKKDILEGRKEELSRIETENENLLKEIDLLKNDPNYQKKVVRDHLGYIAHDEYLVLFPEQIN